MRLSIIVPVYNVERYLNECLDSVLDCQNIKTNDYEVILVNDGSTDGSAEICESYAKKYSQIKYIYQENQGLSGARNTGISAAVGDYLLFLDSDDKLKENVLNSLLELVKQKSPHVILGKASKFSSEDNFVEPFRVDYRQYMDISNPTNLFKNLDNNELFWFAAWLLIVKREFIVSNDLYFYPGIYHEDELWFPSVMLAAKTVSLFNEDFYMYRVNREGSIITNPKIKREFDKLLIADQFNEMKKSASKEAQKVLSMRMGALVWGVVRKCNTYKGNSEYLKLKQEIYKHSAYLKYGKYWLIYFLLCFHIVKL